MGTLFKGETVASPQVNQALARLPQQVSLKPVNVTGGGFSSNLNNGRLSVGTSPLRQALVGNIAQASLNQADIIRQLRGQVTDATTGLRASRLAQVDNARRSAVSNLRDNLARRRVLGSSFGEDALARANLEFAQQADQISAESFLQELDLKNQYISQEYDLRRSAYDAKLSEMNLGADLVSNLSLQANDLFTKAAQFRTMAAATDAELRAKLGIEQARQDASASEGIGSLIGKIAGIGLAPYTGGASLALAL